MNRITQHNPWPFGIITAFSLFFLGTIGLVVMACSQKTDLVSNDYYEQEIKFQNHLDRLHRTERLGSRASVVYDVASQKITISLPPEQVREPVVGRIQLYRPSAARLDREVKLQPDSSGTQAIETTGLPPGLWKVRVSWTADDKEFFIDQRIVIRTRQDLSPGPGQKLAEVWQSK